MIKIFIKDALTYIFKDKRTVQKSLFLFLLVFLSEYSQIFTFGIFEKSQTISLPLLNFIVLGFFTIIVMILINGYKIACIKSLINQSDNFVLPYFNIKTGTRLGIKYTIALLIFLAPLFYLLIGCGFFAGFSILSEHAAFRYVFDIFLILSVALTLVAVLYNFICLIGFNRIFAETEDWFSFIKFKELFSLVKANKKLYFASVVLLVLLALFDQLFLFLLSKTEMGYFSIIPLGVLELYKFYVSVFVISKFTEYQADQHQLQA